MPSAGARLFGAATGGGARAVGRPVGALAPGYRADLVVLDADHPALVARRGDRVLDSFVFSGNAKRRARRAMVGGRWRVCAAAATRTGTASPPTTPRPWPG